MKTIKLTDKQIEILLGWAGADGVGFHFGTEAHPTNAEKLFKELQDLYNSPPTVS